VRERRDSDAAVLAPALMEVHRLDGYPMLERHANAEWLFGGDVDRAWVAEADGLPVGHVSVVRAFSAPGLEDDLAAGPPVLGLTRLFVTPAGRGRGAASALVSEVERYAAEAASPLALEVVEHNAAAIALYERRNWRRITSYATSWFGDDGPHPIAHVYVAPR